MKNQKKEIVSKTLLADVCSRFDKFISHKKNNEINHRLSKSIFDFKSHSKNSERIYAIKMILELLYGIVVTTTPILPKKYPPYHFFYKVTIEQFSKETGFAFIGEYGGNYENGFINSFEALVIGLDEALKHLQQIA